MILPSHDCTEAGGERQTKTPDTMDLPSCWVQPTPPQPAGNTHQVPQIGAANYSKP